MSTDDAQDSGDLVDGPADPEHHPRAAWALEPRDVRRLTSRIVATSSRTHQVFSPVNGQPLADVPQSSPGDVAIAFERARRAQRAWARTSLRERARVLHRFHDLVLERQDAILDLIVWESGKARKHAFDEPLHVALTARYYARKGPATMASRSVPGVVPVLTQVEVNRVPKGVVGLITPWNYPFTMALCDGLPAVMAGNGVVSKPDAQTMLSALYGVSLLEEAGLPQGLWQVVAGAGRELGTPIIEAADYIGFTGSTATGRLIAAQCADRLIGCSLELGGKNPMLVLDDADVERAAEGAVRGAFSNAGQLCVSMERLFVAESVADRFIARFVARTEAMTLGASLDWGTDMGPLISKAQLDRVSAHVADAVAKGATVLTGGRPRPDLGEFFFEPTVLTDVDPSMDLYAHETFGPVISIHRVADAAEAVARANEGEYGLNASVYGRDTRRARQVAREVRAGTVNVNEAFAATFASVAAPMGGMRDSGMGRRQGSEGLLRYTEAQSVAVQRLLRFGPVLGMSDKAYATAMTLSLKVMDKLGRA